MSHCPYFYLTRGAAPSSTPAALNPFRICLLRRQIPGPAVRLQAKSLRSEGASIQRLSSARAVFFVRLAEVCGQLLCNSLIDGILQIVNPQTHLFSGRSADIHFLIVWLSVSYNSTIRKPLVNLFQDKGGTVFEAIGVFHSHLA